MEGIRAWCPICGEVEVSPRDLALFVTASRKKFHLFRCQSCQEDYVRPTSDEVERKLAQANVRVYECPAEAREKHAGPALHPDDLLDLHQQLENEGELSKFFSSFRKAV